MPRRTLISPPAPCTTRRRARRRARSGPRGRGRVRFRPRRAPCEPPLSAREWVTPTRPKVLLLNVLPCQGIESRVSFEVSRARNPQTSHPRHRRGAASRRRRSCTSTSSSALLGSRSPSTSPRGRGTRPPSSIDLDSVRFISRIICNRPAGTERARINFLSDRLIATHGFGHGKSGINPRRRPRN